MAAPAVLVADRGAAGRGLVAARDLAAGEVVLVDLPALLVPAPDAAHGVCSACLRSLPQTAAACIPSCSTCRSALFCSQECASSAARAPSFHSPILCRALSALDLRGLPDADAASATRFVLTMACLRAEASQEQTKNNSDGGGGDEASRSYAALCSMTAPAGAVARLGAREVAGRVSAACAAAGVPPPSPYSSSSSNAGVGWVEEAAHWLAVEEANGFAALSPSTSMASEGGSASSSSSSRPLPRVRGTAFYPRAFLLNHDCLPNLARFDDFEGQGLGPLEPAVAAALARGSVDFLPPSTTTATTTTATADGLLPLPLPPPPTAAQRRTALVAATLHPLPAGEELSLSYVPLAWSRPERGARLSACYGFRCRCARCRGEDEAFGAAAGSQQDAETEAEFAAAIGEAASWVPPFSPEAAAREALEAALRLATAAGHEAGASPPSPAAELGYVRAFLAKFSCPAPRGKEEKKGQGGDGDDDGDGDVCGGTLAPVAAPDGQQYYLCNSCGFVRSEEEFLRCLAALDDDEDDEDDEFEDDEEMEGGDE